MKREELDITIKQINSALSTIVHSGLMDGDGKKVNRAFNVAHNCIAKFLAHIEEQEKLINILNETIKTGMETVIKQDKYIAKLEKALRISDNILETIAWDAEHNDLQVSETLQSLCKQLQQALAENEDEK